MSLHDPPPSSGPRFSRFSRSFSSPFSARQSRDHPVTLYSPGKGRHEDDEEDEDTVSSTSSDGSGGSGGSSEEEEKRRHHKHRKRTRAPIIVQQQSSMNPIVVVLAILLVVAVGAAVYYATKSNSTDDELASSNSSASSSAKTTGATSKASTSAAASASASKSASASGDDDSPSSGSGGSTKSHGSAGGDDSSRTVSSPAASATSGSSGDNSSPTSSSDASSPSSSSASSSSATSDFATACLTAHNDFRATHHVDDLVWNETLANAAQEWVKGCVYEHSGGSLLSSSYGENLYIVGPVAQDAAMEPSDGVKSWENEEKDYTFDPPTGFAENTGHFTQVVWKGTTQLGCYMGTCQGLAIVKADEYAAYLVCEYSPPGNIVGDNNQYFADNVLAP
ncbi:hypothetical protein JCM8547_004403 [Rhodosporidiobolus lusitaniae]